MPESLGGLNIKPFVLQSNLRAKGFLSLFIMLLLLSIECTRTVLLFWDNGA